MVHGIHAHSQLGNVHYRDGRDSCFTDTGRLAERVGFADTIEYAMFAQASEIT